jgi:hypothetical protein
MVCLDENFQPVISHDVAHETMRLCDQRDGILTWTCELCGAIEKEIELTEVCETP